MNKTILLSATHFLKNEYTLKQRFFNLGSRPRGVAWHFPGVAKASDKLIYISFPFLYFVYGTTFCSSQNNRIPWQKWQPTFLFKFVLSVIMTITVLTVLRLTKHD